MLTVAEGGALGAVVVDAHAARRRIVIPVKAELMNVGFHGFEVFGWFNAHFCSRAC